MSCLHYDAPHNLLCQVVGSKRVRLYSPALPARAMYPHAGLMCNTSEADPATVGTPAHDAAFPAFPAAPTYDLVLKAGEE